MFFYSASPKEYNTYIVLDKANLKVSVTYRDQNSLIDFLLFLAMLTNEVQ